MTQSENSIFIISPVISNLASASKPRVPAEDEKG